jgi:hypothetical protein
MSEIKSRCHTRGYRKYSAYLLVWREVIQPVDPALCVQGRAGCRSGRGVVQSGKGGRVDGLQQLELWLRDAGTSLFSWSCIPGNCRTHSIHIIISPHFTAHKIKTNDVALLGFGARASALKMETVCFSETLASTGGSTRRQNPAEHHHPRRRENLKSYKIKTARSRVVAKLLLDLDTDIQSVLFKMQPNKNNVLQYTNGIRSRSILLQ